MVGVAVLCVLTPFNNAVVGNTNLIGSHLPVGLLLLFGGFAVAVNGPLSHVRPGWAFTRGELSVAVAMAAVGCSVPATGLMRYFPGQVVGLNWYAGHGDPDALQLLRALHLPGWMFPTAAATDPAARGTAPVVTRFYDAPAGGGVPWHAWLRPAVAWGVFLAALWGGVLAMGLVLYRQWAENERLPFPLAGVLVSVVEPPAAGRWLNPLLRARSFWVAFGVVFAVHVQRGLAVYRPREFGPRFPLEFDLGSVFTQEPFSWLDPLFGQQTVYLTVVGLAYFIRSRVAFSLWSCFVALQVVRVAYGSRQAEMTGGAELDQMLGSTVVVGGTVLYVARHHLAGVARRMLAGGGPAGWAFVGCLAVLVAWLVAAGASVVGAAVTVGLLLLVFLVVMRIVAETGLPYVLLPVYLDRPWVVLANDVPRWMAARTTVRSFFFADLLHSLFLFDTRESLAGFVPTALQLGDGGGRPRRFVASLIVALTVAYVVGGAATLWVHYTYPRSLETPPQTPVLAYESRQQAQDYVLGPARQYLPPGRGPTEPHGRLRYLAAGLGITAALSVLKLRWAGWPIDPLGYLLVYSWGLQMIWFSLLLGWVAKQVVVRLGGAALFRRARPAFVGLILGESAAIAFWLAVGLVRAVAGEPYHAIQLLP